MSLVSMESSLHEHDRDAVKSAEEKPWHVTGDCRHGEVWDLVVGEDVTVLQQVSQTG